MCTCLLGKKPSKEFVVVYWIGKLTGNLWLVIRKINLTRNF